jgi:transposase
MAGALSDNLPALVPVSVEAESVGLSADAGPMCGVVTIEIGADVVLRVPGDVPTERAAALAHALQGRLTTVAHRQTETGFFRAAPKGTKYQ